VTGHVHDIVDAAEEPDVALFVEARAVAREVEALIGELVPVGLLEALGVAPDAAASATASLPTRADSISVVDRR